MAKFCEECPFRGEAVNQLKKYVTATKIEDKVQSCYGVFIDIEGNISELLDFPVPRNYQNGALDYKALVGRWFATIDRCTQPEVDNDTTICKAIGNLAVNPDLESEAEIEYLRDLLRHYAEDTAEGIISASA